MTKSRAAGMSLVSVLMAVGIMGIVALGLSRLVTNSQDGIRSVELRGDLETIRQLLMAQVDCTSTFAENKITDKNQKSQCPGPGGKGLMLYRSTSSGARPFTKGKLEADGSFQLGSWWIKATCDAEAETLVIRAARKKKDGTFARDPLTNEVMNWNSSRGVLFGTDGEGLPICYGKEMLTGEFAYARREFRWRAGRKEIVRGNVDVIKGKGSTFAEFHIKKDWPAYSFDGIRCTDGWRIVSCSISNNSGVTHDVIRKVQSDPSYRYVFDSDATILPDEDACVTNDPSQLKAMFPSDNVDVIIKATCAKVQ